VPISIERATGIPLYVQVRNQIEKLIRLGIWENGRKLPTERQLADTLRVSRNTVSTAYKLLEQEGLLSCRQGSGTYVAATPDIPDDRRLRLEQAIDQILDGALEMGLDLDDFLQVAGARVEARRDMLRHVQVCLVECNREQLDYFVKELELGSGVAVIPLLISELRERPSEIRSRLSGVDLVVTTFFHLDEVKEVLPDMDVLGIALDPLVETVVRIARLDRDSRAGLVCRSVAFADRVKKSIANAGIDELALPVCTSSDSQSVHRFLAGLDVVVASPGRRREVEAIVPDGVQVIEFIYQPDTGSINLLRSVLLEHKQRRGLATKALVASTVDADDAHGATGLGREISRAG